MSENREPGRVRARTQGAKGGGVAGGFPSPADYSQGEPWGEARRRWGALLRAELDKRGEVTPGFIREMERFVEKNGMTIMFHYENGKVVAIDMGGAPLEFPMTIEKEANSLYDYMLRSMGWKR